MKGTGVAGDEKSAPLQHGQQRGDIRQHRQDGDARGGFAQRFQQPTFTRAVAGHKDKLEAGSGSQFMKARPVCNWPVLLRLSGGEMTNNRIVRQKLFGKLIELRISADVHLQRARRLNAPDREHLQVPLHPGWIETPFVDSLSVAKPTSEEPASGIGTEPLPRAAKQTQYGAAIIADKIDRAIEALPPQRTDEGPGVFESGAPARSGHTPDFIQPGQVLINGRELRRRQHV